MQQLCLLIQQLESKIPDHERHAPSVSKSPVGWHIEHALLTINVIVKALENADPKDYRWSFNWIRTLVFTLNKIPRGKAQAPATVQPKNAYTTASLNEYITVTLEQINKLNGLPKNSFIPHPFFGKLNLKPTIKFLGIHTRHHLAIINGIIHAGEKS